MKSQKARIIASLFLLTLLLAATWSWTRLTASPMPLIPFDRTGDLYVVESLSGIIYRVREGDEGPIVERALTAEQITKITGRESALFRSSALAFDLAGNMYFSEQESRSIFVLRADGTLEQMVTEEQLATHNGSSPPAADPEGLAFGSDGHLYIVDDETDAILRMDPGNGRLQLYVTKAQIQEAVGPDAEISLNAAVAGAEAGLLYVASAGEPSALIAVRDQDDAPPTLTRLAPDFEFQELDGFLARAQDGSIIVADTPPAPDGEPTQHVLYRVSPDGNVSPFLTPEQIRAANGRQASADVTLTAGFAFDGEGNFILAQSGTDDLLKFPVNQESGMLYVEESIFKKQAGTDDCELNGGIAFARRG